MKRQLQRILRIRELVEDFSRLDFEGRMAEMRDLQLAAERQWRLARSVRGVALKLLSEEDSGKHKDWLMGMADAEISSWKAARLRAVCEAVKPAVNKAREEMLAHRLERLQVDILHSAAARAEEKHQIRQEQNRTDDRFQSRPGRRSPKKR
jgi:hypothetical protein